VGTLDRSQVFAIVEALISRDARRVVASVNELDERAPDYREVLAELAALLQKLALLQAVPELQLDEAEDIEAYRRLASALTAEDTQLFYQIAILGRRDLELAPDARAGFEMTLLRMLAFGVADAAALQSGAGSASRAGTASAASAAAVATAPKPAVGGGDWPQIVARLNLQGMVKQLAAHCAWLGKQGPKVQLKLDADGEHFRTAALEDKLTQALGAYYGEPVRLEFILATEAVNTPARQQKAAQDDRMQNARTAIENDPNVRAMRDIFGASVQPDSIRPGD
jgi:DNA polymerase-3 subunit gamma/tau